MEDWPAGQSFFGMKTAALRIIREMSNAALYLSCLSEGQATRRTMPSALRSLVLASRPEVNHTG